MPARPRASRSAAGVPEPADPAPAHPAPADPAPAGPAPAGPEPAVPGAADFGAQVAAVVRSIPPGHVMTYGDVAAVLGSRASRAVGKVMAHEGSDLPWWRVVRSGGLPPVDHEARALEHHRAEGTPLRWSRDDASWRIDMPRARWSPTDDGWSADDGWSD
ncbi:cysteine methyltransferase [Curtobacterium sp. MCPF17_011]|uniref:MGMT family protein n=1 Tax=Curtobacterium sp. MCPF17_011 TaxID=2175652 RepID=UPI000DA6F0D4|nr:MGMT family protein [Curtobacterium sp. MCPF17_011]PZF15255.1 cysteine methyltransferase [Curtobacterium sp. MCPF17_011]